jgi:hypothetical protein
MSERGARVSQAVELHWRQSSLGDRATEVTMKVDGLNKAALAICEEQSEGVMPLRPGREALLSLTRPMRPQGPDGVLRQRDQASLLQGFDFGQLQSPFDALKLPSNRLSPGFEVAVRPAEPEQLAATGTCG